jgi:hypothetical protein
MDISNLVFEGRFNMLRYVAERAWVFHPMARTGPLAQTFLRRDAKCYALMSSIESERDSCGNKLHRMDFFPQVAASLCPCVCPGREASPSLIASWRDSPLRETPQTKVPRSDTFAASACAGETWKVAAPAR